MREMANVTVAIDSDSQQNQEDSGSLDSSSSSARSINNGIGVISITPPESPALGYNNNRVHHHNKSAAAAVKFKLLLEGDVQVCRLNHTRTIISKIMNSRYLRRWESQHLVLGDSDIRTAEVTMGFYLFV